MIKITRLISLYYMKSDRWQIQITLYFVLPVIKELERKIEKKFFGLCCRQLLSICLLMLTLSRLVEFEGISQEFPKNLNPLATDHVIRRDMK